MTIHTTPHLNFRGTAREALEHYQSVFGGDLVAATYADMGAPAGSPGAHEVVFGQVVSEQGFQVMAYDVPADRPYSRGDDPFFVSVRGDDLEEITGYWDRLSDGATVLVPLAPSAWSPLYGMLTDPFGITWVLDVSAPRGQ